MEESKQSDQVVELGKRMYAQFDYIEKRFDFVDQRTDEIEEMIQRLFWFIEFHLGEVPMKYRKAFPKKGEYPYFSMKNKNIPELNKISELEIPKDSEVLQAAKDRMLKLGEKGWPKRVNAEAFLASWEQRDSRQAHTPNESSPPSDESPDHKSPPSQT